MTESDTNFVYVSDLLARRFSSVYAGLERILGEHDIGFGVVRGTRDIWIRDYAPIQVDRDGSFVLFRYFPDYLRHGYRHLITDAREFIASIPAIRSCEFSEIILDGGNVVRHGDKAIVTDKVYRENQGMGREELRQELRRLLRVERLIVIPTEPGDVVGHADGMVRFVEGDVILANDYKIVDDRHRATLGRVLGQAGLEVIELPYRPQAGKARGIPSASGCYLNYLRVGRLIVLPSFGLPEDEETWSRVQCYFPDSDVQSLACSDLSVEGGVLNCASWTVLGPRIGEDRAGMSFCSYSRTSIIAN